MSQAQVSAQVFEMMANQAAEHAEKASTKDAKKPQAKKPQGKPQGKPQAKKETKPQGKGDAYGIKFAMRPGFRPGAGTALFAYTAAWLEGLNMHKGAIVPRAVCVKLAGQTAVSYHVTSTGRFEESEKGIKLAPGAWAFFTGDKRKHESKDREEFRALLASGEPDGKIAKNKAAFDSLA
jgi:hypothetical protein